jgi:hypothetical protein
VLVPDPKQALSQSLREGLDSGVLTGRDLLVLPHYALVQAASGCFREGRYELLVEIVSALAASSAEQAGIVVSDLYGVTKQSPQGWSEFLSRLRASPSWGEVDGSLRELPTLDAHEFRTQMLGHDRRQSALQQLSMVAHLRGSFTQGLHELFRFIGYSRLVSCDEVRDPALGDMLKTEAYARYNPVASPDELSGRPRYLCDEFAATIQKRFFPVDRYGYGSGADALTLEMPLGSEKSGSRYQFLGGDEGEKQRNLNARVNAKLIVPWPDTPDLPPLIGHQCVDSASSARSFFVGRGIPADIYLIQIGTLYHNVCVAFFQEKGRYTPVVVDASPFGGAYPLKGEAGATVWRPQLIESVYNVRNKGLPFVAENSWGGLGSRSGNLSGFLPWACVEIPEGRVITFAGIYDQPVHPNRCWERGTPEFYGRGERFRCLGFAVSVIPSSCEGQTQTMHRITVKSVDGSFEILEQSSDLPNSLRNRVYKILKGQLRGVQETVARLNLPLGNVTW